MHTKQFRFACSLSALFCFLSACGSSSRGTLSTNEWGSLGLLNSKPSSSERSPEKNQSPTKPRLPDTAHRALQLRVLELINHLRATGTFCGGRYQSRTFPLKMNRKLERSAEKHAMDMAKFRYFSHDSLDGRTFDVRIKNEGYLFQSIGENIAWTEVLSAETVMDGWEGSPHHCVQMMDSGSEEIGIGFAATRIGQTLRVYWVTDFGSPPS